jgi:tetratricopeptide (TPR) repeat protein
MRPRKTRVAVTVLMTSFLVASRSVVAEGRAEYGAWASEARQTLAAELPRHDLPGWSDELAAAIPTADGPLLCLAISVFQRSGQPERIEKVIPRLKRLINAERTDSGVVYWMCQRGHYAQIRQWLDAFPQDVCYDEMRAFLRRFEERDGAKAVEVWLRDKASHERVAVSAIDGWYGGVWSRLYWGQLQGAGKLQSHVAALAKAVRRRPARMDAVLEYVGARCALAADDRKSVHVGWLAGATRLEYALDNWGLGRMLAAEKEYEGAIRLFDKSLDCPITDYDRQNFNRVSMSQMWVPPAELEAVLRRWTRGALAEACFHAGKLDRAQKLVEELTGKRDGTLRDCGPFLFAGQTQAASGLRVVEVRIKNAEAERKDSVRYWLNRADYYVGRMEYEQAEQAYLSALSLPAEAGNSADGRWEVVRDYGWFLFDRQRYGEAERVYRTEIGRAGDDPNGSPDFWFNQLARLDGKGDVRFPWDDPLVWRWLEEENRRSFSQSAQTRMEWAAKKAGETPAGWAAFERRARALSAAPCAPPLRFCLGTILLRHGLAQEGLRMMADAYEHWPVDGYPGAQYVGETVLGAYLDQGDWMSAEKMLERLKMTPGFSGLEGTLGRIALAAARANARDDAMRLWLRKAALDLTNQDDLDALAIAGLADRLRDYYAGLAKRAPGNGAIAAALKTLEAK